METACTTLERRYSWGRLIALAETSSGPTVSAVEFRILGPLEVVEDGRSVVLGGRKQKVVLARLLMRTNQMVSTSTLIDEVWGDEPPEAVRSSLQSYISHLRKALGDGRIRSGSGGYALSATPEEIDAKRFESLIDQARREAFDDPATAAATFGRALALWRGPPFADLADELSLLGESRGSMS